jgi:predicted RNase H-like nuclease (RuvC/YqgF family)
MGNIIAYVDISSDKQKISDLQSDNEALRKQVESLKTIIKKEGQIIADLEKEVKKNKKE